VVDFVSTLRAQVPLVDGSSPQGAIEKNPSGQPQRLHQGTYWAGAGSGAGTGVAAAMGFGLYPGGGSFG